MILEDLESQSLSYTTPQSGPEQCTEQESQLSQRTTWSDLRFLAGVPRPSSEALPVLPGAPYTGCAQAPVTETSNSIRKENSENRIYGSTTQSTASPELSSSCLPTSSPSFHIFHRRPVNSPVVSSVDSIVCNILPKALGGAC